MSSSKLGFGMMRLPLRSDDPADIDLDAVRDMTDRFLAAGFTYFDTSAVYHGGAGLPGEPVSAGGLCPRVETSHVRDHRRRRGGSRFSAAAGTVRYGLF